MSFCPHFPKLQHSEYFGENNGKKWSTNSGFKIAAQFLKFSLMIFPCKTWGKPCFPLDQRPLVEGCIPNFGISLEVLSFCVSDDFFLFLFLFFVSLVKLQCIMKVLQRGGSVAFLL